MTIYLYVKTHKVTGLKYLGQTEKDPFKYKGSGVHWKRHLKVHGNDVETEILRECHSKEELKEWGLYYSKLFNVVKDSNWANLMEEAGDGCAKGRTPWNKGKKTGVSAWNKGLSKETHPSIKSYSLKSSGKPSHLKGKSKQNHDGIRSMANTLTGRTKDNHEGRKKQADTLTGRTKDNHEGRKKQAERVAATWKIINITSGKEIILNGSELANWCANHGFTRSALMSAYYRGKAYNDYTIIKLINHHPSESIQDETNLL